MSRAGVPNKNKQALLAMLKARYPEWHPVMQLADIANDPEQDINLRFNAAKEVATYVTPKLKAVEVSGPNGGPIHTEGMCFADTELANRLLAWFESKRKE